MEWYSILELDPKNRQNISHTDIKRQYYKLAKIHHPDKSGDETKFLEIHQAYEVLSNENKRKLYDDTLEPVKNTSWVGRMATLLFGIGSLIPINCFWDRDIDLLIKVTNVNDYIKINYNCWEYIIKGSVIDFQYVKKEITVFLPGDFDCEDELFCIEKAGNDIVEKGKIIKGDLNLDIVLV